LIQDIVGTGQLQSAVRLGATARYLGLLAGPAVGAGILWSGKFSFTVSRQIKYRRDDLGWGLCKLLWSPQQVVKPSGDPAARVWTMELGIDSRGTSDARKTILGCFARPEWPD
ncbi:MAG: hypothetical protein LAO22_22600, partial [Acidobacteriia bacterium]|nr:hypothetical protein [Terriglobia bacterium]